LNLALELRAWRHSLVAPSIEAAAAQDFFDFSSKRSIRT
jgi:hypothetical protein